MYKLLSYSCIMASFLGWQCVTGRVVLYAVFVNLLDEWRLSSMHRKHHTTAQGRKCWDWCSAHADIYESTSIGLGATRFTLTRFPGARIGGQNVFKCFVLKRLHHKSSIITFVSTFHKQIFPFCILSLIYHRICSQVLQLMHMRVIVHINQVSCRKPCKWLRMCTHKQLVCVYTQTVHEFIINEHMCFSFRVVSVHATTFITRVTPKWTHSHCECTRICKLCKSRENSQWTWSNVILQ